MVRDPRDFLLSYRNKGEGAGGANRARLRRLYHPVLTSLLWRTSVRRLLDDRASLIANYASAALVLAVLALMVFKP